jgi:hypothetical protein
MKSSIKRKSLVISLPFNITSPVSLICRITEGIKESDDVSGP